MRQGDSLPRGREPMNWTRYRRLSRWSLQRWAAVPHALPPNRCDPVARAGQHGRTVRSM